MLESLFGAETPLAVRFFVAFIVVFALIGVIAWLVRRFGTGALGTQGSRGRAPRLAVIEAGAVDGRRKLVLIRRDNVEHLIMIGGPADIVVEQNIVRGQNAREVPAARGTGAAESLPRAVPLGDETTWPLQPEVTPRPARTPRPVPAPSPAIDEAMQWPTPEPKVATPALKRPQRASDTLAGLAAELSTRPAMPSEPEIEPVAVAPVRPGPKAEPRLEPKVELKAEPKLDIKPEPKPEIRAPQPAAAATSSDDQNLADMAQRLEAALRRPGGPLATPAAAPAPAVKPVAEKPVAPAPEKKPAPKPDNVFGSLEEEMASLLGRPPGKT